jgi:phage terminase large subunit GpA-like protein
MRERNEALDARVYARAAASRVGIDRFREQHWADLERRMSRGAPVILTTPPSPSSPPPQGAPRAPRNRVRFRMGF